MKDDRTHLAHKAEHAVDMEAGALVAVTVQGADQGDTTTLLETMIETEEQVAAVAEDGKANEQLAPDGIEEVVAGKGYHSSDVVGDLTALALRSYISDPERDRRKWRGKREQQQAVYANRRHIRGRRGKQLLWFRGERAERSFAHFYETGGMRRTHMRGHENVLKRLLIHAGGFNSPLVPRKKLGVGTPRGMAAARTALDSFAQTFGRFFGRIWTGAIGLLSARVKHRFRFPLCAPPLCLHARPAA